MAEIVRTNVAAIKDPERSSFWEVFSVFLRLGCTSFGGPIAHLGYFRKEFVERRSWCGEETMAELIALAQSLPGPASSQVGFALGVLRAGWSGGVAAWLGFTTPSVVLLLLFSYGVALLNTALTHGILHGLQLVAVAVVAQAVMSMQRSLAPDRARLALAVASTAITLMLPAQFATLVVVLLGAALGIAFFRGQSPAQENGTWRALSKRAGLLAAVIFCSLLAVSITFVQNPAMPILSPAAALYRCGALVFGGGHVVLPLLEDAVVTKGWVQQSTFLAGYGAAQALPGPLFAIGAYVGAETVRGPLRMLSATLCLLAIFLPGLLAMAALLPVWRSVRTNRWITPMLKGVNAGVVGVLVAALYRPLWTSTIQSATDFWIALAAFTALTVWKFEPRIVVLLVVVLTMTLR